MTDQAFCTIITKRYLPFARTLADSLNKHHPNIPLYVLLVDKIDKNTSSLSSEHFKIIHLEDLSDFKTVERMCFYYTPFELCNALKGWLHEYMFEQTNVHKWIYLDSDIALYHSIDDVFKQLDHSSILLTPHRITPVKNTDTEPFEFTFLNVGIYNGGFLGIRRSEFSKPFVSWFKNRLTHYLSFDSSSKNLFVDQAWLNFAPLFFKDAAVYSNPGANVAHWNLSERVIKKETSGEFTVNGQPLLFFHFSGWDINNISNISIHPTYCTETLQPDLWLELSESYKKSLLRNGYLELVSSPYAFDHFDNGRAITTTVRRAYYHLLKRGMGQYPSFSDENYRQLKKALKKNLPLKKFFPRGLEIVKRCIKGIIQAFKNDL